ncbi:MAG: hypothetical protein WA510_22395 [Acidobacteriaceae bacterium]
MEADWSVALLTDDPVIAVPWSAEAGATDLSERRFVDLRLDKDAIDEIEEARARPGLRSALLLLNCAGSPFWTAKCDVWSSGPDQGDLPLDPYEMDAQPGQTDFGAGSYVDLLRRDPAWLSSFERQEQWMRQVTERLRATPATAARIELVLRRAEVQRIPGFGVTWFVEGCGATAEDAAKKWDEALAMTLPVILDTILASAH